MPSRSLLLVLFGISVVATGCVQQTKTTPIETKTTRNIPTDLKPAIFALAALKKTKDANKSYKEKDFDSAEKKCQEQLTLVDKIDIEAIAVEKRNKMLSSLLTLKISCLHVLGKISSKQKDWSQAIDYHNKALEYIDEGEPLKPESDTWDEFRGEIYWLLTVAYLGSGDTDAVIESIPLVEKQSKLLIGKSKHPQKWRAINLLANWELRRQDFDRHKTNNFVEDVANFQLMIDEIEKEAQAYRAQAAGDEKALKLADHLDNIVRDFQGRLNKIYDNDFFDLRIAS